MAYGSSVNEALAAADMLERDGVSTTVIDARFCKPLDTKLIRSVGAPRIWMQSLIAGSYRMYSAGGCHASTSLWCPHGFR